jgi:hypothetical protein
MSTAVHKKLREGAVRDTKSAGFCTGECGTTGKECKECKKVILKTGWNGGKAMNIPRWEGVQ